LNFFFEIKNPGPPQPHPNFATCQPSPGGGISKNHIIFSRTQPSLTAQAAASRPTLHQSCVPGSDSRWAPRPAPAHNSLLGFPGRNENCAEKFACAYPVDESSCSCVRHSHRTSVQLLSVALPFGSSQCDRFAFSGFR
jgi:hypothetical protein